MTTQFYSARNQIVVIVDDPKHGVDGMYRCDNTCVLFQANDDEHAFQRALHYGKCQETEYVNADGQRVRWVFRKVEQICRLNEPLEGLEIGSVLASEKFDERLNIDTTFDPATHRPYFEDCTRIAESVEDGG